MVTAEIIKKAEELRKSCAITVIYIMYWISLKLQILNLTACIGHLWIWKKNTLK